MRDTVEKAFVETEKKLAEANKPAVASPKPKKVRGITKTKDGGITKTN